MHAPVEGELSHGRVGEREVAVAAKSGERKGESGRQQGWGIGIDRAKDVGPEWHMGMGAAYIGRRLEAARGGRTITCPRAQVAAYPMRVAP